MPACALPAEQAGHLASEAGTLQFIGAVRGGRGGALARRALKSARRATRTREPPSPPSQAGYDARWAAVSVYDLTVQGLLPATCVRVAGMTAAAAAAAAAACPTFLGAHLPARARHLTAGAPSTPLQPAHGVGFRRCSSISPCPPRRRSTPRCFSRPAPARSCARRRGRCARRRRRAPPPPRRRPRRFSYPTRPSMLTIRGRPTRCSRLAPR
jgi:hypothetical protein